MMLLLRVFKRNGSALPGLYAEKLYPKLIQKQLDQLEDGVIIVTGTNGKTTTTKSLVYLLEQCGKRVVTNPTGSNFTRGIYASILKYSLFSGRLDYDIAVFELDEAYSRVFAHIYRPRLVLALNVMRDQLDRYGEIDKTAEMIGETVSLATDGVILNADDERVRKLAEQAQCEVSFFGVASNLKHELPEESEFHGISIHSAKKHEKHHKKKRAKRAHVSVELRDYKNGSIGIGVGEKIYHSAVGVAGIHNAFNLTAAVATTMRACPEIEPQFIVPNIKDIPAAFGRGEVIRVGEQSIVLALVKNPSGFRQSIQSYDSDSYDAMAFVINDNFADGRDVSWLWDVDFKEIAQNSAKYTSGVRGDDMALRLKYDGIQATVVPGLGDLLDTIIESGADQTLIYCTYTAMLELRRQLAARTKVEGIW